MLKLFCIHTAFSNDHPFISDQIGYIAEGKQHRVQTKFGLTLLQNVSFFLGGGWWSGRGVWLKSHRRGLGHSPESVERRERVINGSAKARFPLAVVKKNEEKTLRAGKDSNLVILKTRGWGCFEQAKSWFERR